MITSSVMSSSFAYKRYPLEGGPGANGIGLSSGQPQFNTKDAQGAGPGAGDIVSVPSAHLGSFTAVAAPSLSSMPLSEAWAPQLFSQADQDGDGSVSEDEFTAQLSRAGVSDDDAGDWFRTFGGRDSGGLTVEQYFSGIQHANISGSTVFNQLVASYTQDKTGRVDVDRMVSFLDEGAKAADAFWKGA